MNKEIKLNLLKDRMKQLASQIGRAEIQRANGEYVNVDKIKKEFAKVQAQHKKLYFSK